MGALRPRTLQPARRSPPCVRAPREGTLLDVATEQIFIGLFLRNLSQNLVVEENNLRLEFKATSRFADYTIKEPERIRAIEQSNSTALVDNQYVAKIYRQLEGGINPEIEIGSYLTEIARFANTPALLGSVELVEDDSRSAVGVLHAYVENQGDGWAVTAGYLDRYIDEQRVLPPGEMPRRPRSKRPICTSWRRSAGGSPSCMWLSPPQSPTISRRSRSAPHRSSAGHPSSRHGPSGFSSGWPPAATACGRPTGR